MISYAIDFMEPVQPTDCPGYWSCIYLPATNKRDTSLLGGGVRGGGGGGRKLLDALVVCLLLPSLDCTIVLLNRQWDSVHCQD